MLRAVLGYSHCLLATYPIIYDMMLFQASCSKQYQGDMNCRRTGWPVLLLLTLPTGKYATARLQDRHVQAAEAVAVLSRNSLGCYCSKASSHLPDMRMWPRPMQSCF